MKNHIIVVFGKPGTGKSYVAKILEEKFGYFPYNGDDALPLDMKNTLFKREEITEDMRDRFLNNMITKIRKLAEVNSKVVVHQTFLREFMRKTLLSELPNATFLLIETDDPLREKRYMERKYFNLGIPYLRKMTDLFEDVRVPHEIIYNNKEGPQEIIKQLRSILFIK